VIFVCENNGYGMSTSTARSTSVKHISQRAAGYSMPGVTVDGNDFSAVAEALHIAISRARAGEGPSLVENITYRWRGHVGHREDNDVGVARKEGLIPWKLRDPIGRLVTAMNTAGIETEDTVATAWSIARSDVETAWAQAFADPYPAESALLERVYSQPTA
jgi:pyruvate dehydrogenase E1 component alpha subunit